MNIEQLKRGIAHLEAQLESGVLDIRHRTGVRRCIGQRKRRLAECLANGGVLPEPSQLRNPRLYARAQRILSDTKLMNEINAQRAEAERLRSIDQGLKAAIDQEYS